MTRSGFPVKAWLLLGMAVLLGHLVLLQSLPLTFGPPADAPPLRFTTRTLALPATTSPTTVKPAQPRAARPQPKVARSVARAQPTPMATPAPAETTRTEVAPPADTPAPQEASASAATPPDVVDAPAAATEPPAAPEQPTRDDAFVFDADRLSASVKLVYRVDSNKFPYRLNGELLWQHTSASYQARMAFSAFGQTRMQTSHGLIGPDGLAPERFADKYRSEVAAHFNRTLGKVTFSANTPDLPLLRGAQDRLSVLIQLGALVASSPERFTPGTTLSIQTIGPRAGDLWLFSVEKTDALTLPGGTQEALKLVRHPREPYDQQVEVWLAPGLQYLPARLRITESNGDYIDQTWQSTEPAPPPD